MREGERPVADIARQFGIAGSCLRRWIRQVELNRGLGDDGYATAEREESRRLRRENARLKQAEEILRKAARLFAREEIW